MLKEIMTKLSDLFTKKQPVIYQDEHVLVITPSNLVKSARDKLYCDVYATDLIDVDDTKLFYKSHIVILNDNGEHYIIKNRNGPTGKIVPNAENFSHLCND